MKKRLLQKLFALSLSLLVALALTACTPEIHIHTGESSSETAVTDETVKQDEPAQKEESKTENSTSVASSEPKPSNNSSNKNTSTASKATSSKSSSSDLIGEAKAKSIALKDAGLKESQIYDYEIELDRDSGTLHYDISFESNGKDYEYDINATTGKIISFEKPKSTSSKTTSSESSSSSTISKSKAKSIALKDAGLKESQIYDYEIELDRDNGVTKYEVSFEYEGRDYDYEINAKTGKIISVEKPNATSSEAKISKSKAKSTALNHAGVKAADISHYQIELEKDDGVWKYEISFNKGYVEYEYTINAENGEILHSEKDIDD